MKSNLDRYRKDLDILISKGNNLFLSMRHDCYPKQVKEELGKEYEKTVKNLPNCYREYQSWYSEAKVLIKQLLPDRLNDFVRHYEKPKPRKDISFENYRIEDYLQDLIITREERASFWGETYSRGEKTVVGPDAALPHFQQQIAILDAVSKRFESSLFDIRQLVQADLIDSELEMAKELLKKGFLRASGAVSGVVLEKHLAQVTRNHGIKIRKRQPTINDFSEQLKKEEVVDTPIWRKIQRLADIRNVCDHNKDREPTKDEVQELISGVEKFTKTLF